MLKKRKTIQDQGEKEIKTLEKHGKNCVNLIKVVKTILVSTKMMYQSLNKRKY